MDPITIDQIEAQLKNLLPEKLAVVYDFVAFLAQQQKQPTAMQTMLASEAALRKDWDTPAEDEAWAHL
jgi:hypothetical protein